MYLLLAISMLYKVEAVYGSGNKVGLGFAWPGDQGSCIKNKNCELNDFLLLSFLGVCCL
jgi:hypothetical protein